MKFIGITGGVGAGKSEILSYIAQRKDSLVVYADEIAGRLMNEPGICRAQLQKTFSSEKIYDVNGNLDKNRIRTEIFSSENKTKSLNDIVHPAVREEILKQVQDAQKNVAIRFFFVEAALLIEDHYDEVCDELWYIDADEDVRRKRLIKSRGYQNEWIDNILQKQLLRSAFMEKCKVMIDNNGALEDALSQVDKLLQK